MSIKPLFNNMSLNVIGLIKQFKKSDRTDLKNHCPLSAFMEKSSL